MKFFTTLYINVAYIDYAYHLVIYKLFYKEFICSHLCHVKQYHHAALFFSD